MNETRSAGAIIDDAIAQTGWDDASLVDILLQYIEQQGDNATFADYIAEMVEMESE